jgi:hypothetical protein
MGGDSKLKNMEKIEAAPSALPNPDQFNNGYDYYEALKLSLGFVPEDSDELENGIPKQRPALIENENCVIRHSDKSGYGDDYHVYFPKERKVLFVTINDNPDGNMDGAMHLGSWTGPEHSFSVHEYTYDEYNEIYNDIWKAPEAK